MRKKILIATHEYSKIYQNMVWDLEESGNEVGTLLFKDPESSYALRTFKDYSLNILFSLIGKQKEFKNDMNRRYHESDIISQIKNYKENYFDTCLFIRADFFSDKTLEKAFKISKHSFSYHWDGLDRFPRIHSLINKFDDFYVFENSDYEKYKLKYTNLKVASNFYFTQNKPQKEYPCIDVFYIGEFIETRIEDVLFIYKNLKDLKLNVKIMLWGLNDDNVRKYANEDITFFGKTIGYSETLEMSKSSKIILDFLAKGKTKHGKVDHKGMSLRFYEAIYHENKVITNNSEVIKEDFYNSNNIFIVGHDDINELSNFIQKKFIRLEKKILRKYSFVNWFDEKSK